MASNRGSQGNAGGGGRGRHRPAWLREHGRREAARDRSQGRRGKRRKQGRDAQGQFTGSEVPADPAAVVEQLRRLEQLEVAVRAAAAASNR